MPLTFTAVFFLSTAATTARGLRGYSTLQATQSGFSPSSLPLKDIRARASLTDRFITDIQSFFCTSAIKSMRIFRFVTDTGKHPFQKSGRDFLHKTLIQCMQTNSVPNSQKRDVKSAQNRIFTIFIYLTFSFRH